MLKVIILEDNLTFQRQLQEWVEQRIMINPTATSYADMQLTLQTADPEIVKAQIQADYYLAILDIELATSLSGIDIAEIIRQRAKFAAIIFVTAYQEYLPYTVSRRIEPLDYINKDQPTDALVSRLREDLDEAYQRYRVFSQFPQHQVDQFVYEPTHGIKRRVNFADIFYLEAVSGQSRRIRIVGQNVHAEYTGTLTKITDARFLKVSRGVLVNPNNIIEFDQQERQLYFDDDCQIGVDVSYRNLKMLKNWLRDHSKNN